MAMNGSVFCSDVKAGKTIIKEFTESIGKKVLIYAAKDPEE